MTIEDPVVGYWDTEWSPAITYSWTQRPKYIPNEMLLEAPRIICFGAKKAGQKSVTVVDERDPEMLVKLRDWLTEVDILVSYNGIGFDTRKVNSEFMKAGLEPPAPYKELDLYRQIRKKASFYSHKLDYIADELVNARKTDTGGFKLWRGVLEGDEAAWRKMRTYQRQDVNLLEEVHEKVKPWLDMPHQISGDPDSCHNCGSLDLQKRGTARTLYGQYQRYQCQDCGKWLRGTLRSGTTNIRRVV